jgi:hypothetical protein
LTKKVLDALLGSLLLADNIIYEVSPMFHIWPGIYIHDPVGTDDTTTWSPREELLSNFSPAFEGRSICHVQVIFKKKLATGVGRRLSKM